MSADRLQTNESDRQQEQQTARSAPARQLATTADVGVVKSFAQHLGVQFSWNANDMHEINKRLAAMVQRWEELGNFWFAATSKKVKRTIFITNAMSADLSGLTTLPASYQQYALLDSKLVGYLRSMMEGTAHSEDRQGRHAKMTHAEVFRFWGILLMKYENLVRTVAWLKDITRKPAQHRQLLAAVWGEMWIDSSKLPGKRDQKLTCQDVLDARGHIAKEEGDNANLARHFEEAVWLMASFSGAESFLEEWEEAASGLLRGGTRRPRSAGPCTSVGKIGPELSSCSIRYQVHVVPQG